MELNYYNKRMSDLGRRRRAKLLREYNTGETLVNMALRHGISYARMQKLISKAKTDRLTKMNCDE